MPKRTKQCREQWKKLPFTSKHIWKTNGSVHENPTYCEKCGKSYQEYSDRLLKEADKLRNKI